MTRVYYTTSNNGDGSASVHFYDSQECIDFLEENDPEGYGMGEGGGCFDVDGFLSGIEVQTLEQVKAEWEEWNSY